MKKKSQVPAPESHDRPSPPGAAGRSGNPGRIRFALLEVPRQWMRYCWRCESDEMFIAGWECELGLVGYCLGCSEESIAPFTRSTTEAA